MELFQIPGSTYREKGIHNDSHLSSNSQSIYFFIFPTYLHIFLHIFHIIFSHSSPHFLHISLHFPHISSYFFIFFSYFFILVFSTYPFIFPTYFAHIDMFHVFVLAYPPIPSLKLVLCEPPPWWRHIRENGLPRKCPGDLENSDLSYILWAVGFWKIPSFRDRKNFELLYMSL